MEVEVVASSSVCVSLLCVVALSHSLVPRCVSVCDGTIAVASASSSLRCICGLIAVMAAAAVEAVVVAVAAVVDGGGGGGGGGGGRE